MVSTVQPTHISAVKLAAGETWILCAPMQSIKTEQQGSCSPRPPLALLTRRAANCNHPGTGLLCSSSKKCFFFVTVSEFIRFILHQTATGMECGRKKLHEGGKTSWRNLPSSGVLLLHLKSQSVSMTSRNYAMRNSLYYKNKNRYRYSS